MSLGIWEILAIAMVALLFFGPSRLPGLGQSVGEAIRGFKKGMDGLDEESSKTAPKDAPKNAQGPTSAPQAEALKQEAQPTAGASAEAATQESTKQTSGNGSKPT